MKILQQLRAIRNVTLGLIFAAAVFFNWALSGPFNVFTIFAALVLGDFVLIYVAHTLGSVTSWYRVGVSEEYGRQASIRDRDIARLDIKSHLTPEECEQFDALNAKIEAAYEDVGT